MIESNKRSVKERHKRKMIVLGFVGRSLISWNEGKEKSSEMIGGKMFSLVDEVSSLFDNTLRTLPTATVLPSSLKVNRPRWGNRLNGSMQMTCPDWDNSNWSMTTWSCLMNLGCFCVRSPDFRLIKVINFFSWTSTAEAWIWRTVE